MNQDFSKFLPHLLEWADCLINADELKKAHTLLTEFVPGYYRDHPPECVTKKIKELDEFLMTAADYQVNPGDKPTDLEYAGRAVTTHLRGQLTLHDVKQYNEKGVTPHVTEFGPGDFWLALGMKAQKAKFTYDAIGLHGEYLAQAKALLGDTYQTAPKDVPTIYFACEIIEHLWHEWEVRQWANRMPKLPDVVHISTPKYKYAGPEYIWRTKPREGGHLRTYTPGEFQSIVFRMFPEYTWSWIDNEIQHMRGELKLGSQTGFVI